MTLEEFKIAYVKYNRSERVFDYGTGILLLVGAAVLIYKGLFAMQSNAVLQLLLGVFMLVAGIVTLWSVKTKYEMITVPLEGSLDQNVALMENIAAQYAEQPVLAETAHLRFWIHGGLSKISYIVEMYATEDQVLYNLRMSRGIVDVMGSARKKRKEIEGAILSQNKCS